MCRIDGFIAASMRQVELPPENQSMLAGEDDFRVQCLHEDLPAMSDRSRKPFDGVESMRQARDKLSAEIEGMTYEELVRWLRDHRYTDPVLQRLADKAAQQADAPGRPPTGR